LCVTFKSATTYHELIEGGFAIVSKRWMAEIVRETGKLNKVSVD
jgi:hypothetical protein